MLAGGVCFLIGAILTSTATRVPQLVIGRVVLGLGVGASALQHKQDHPLGFALSDFRGTHSVEKYRKHAVQRPARLGHCEEISKDELGHFSEQGSRTCMRLLLHAHA